MVKLLGFSLSYRSQKAKFGDVEDKGDRDVYLAHLRTFKFVAFCIWVFCILVTMTSWWGNPMNCFSDTHKIVSNKIMTSYCFITINCYQWTWMILVMQSALTYLPCLVWKCLERGKMRRLLHRDSSIETISKFLYEHPGWFTESDALNFYFCQILCVAVPVFQLLLMEFYLGGGGGGPLQSLFDLTWPPPSVFPLTTRCDFPGFYSSGGELQKVSGLCTLNYNFLYEKVYLVLYLIFSLLFVTSVVQVILQTLLAVSSKLRLAWFIISFPDLRRSKIVPEKELEKILGYNQLLLYMLIQNNLVFPNEITNLVTNIVSYKKGLVEVKETNDIDKAPEENLSISTASSTGDQVRHRDRIDLGGLMETAV